MRGSAICFYYEALGHMFLLVGCGRGARPYVSISRLWAWRWAICLYWLAVGHMFLLCVCICICVCEYVYMYVCVYMCVYVCMYVCVCVYVCVFFIGLLHHREGTCWRYITSSNKLKLKCTLLKLCVNDPYKAASCRH